MSYLPLNGGCALPIARFGRLGWWVEGANFSLTIAGSLTIDQEKEIARICAAALRAAGAALAAPARVGAP